MGIPDGDGAEGRRFCTPVCRFPEDQRPDAPDPVLHAPGRGGDRGCRPSQVHLEAGPVERLLPGPADRGGTAENSIYVPQGDIPFYTHALWSKERSGVFQSLMQRVLAELTEFSTAYMDDVVIFSSTWEDHVSHIDVLKTLGEAGLTVNPLKCKWGGVAVEILGHYIGKGLMSVPEHIGCQH